LKAPLSHSPSLLPSSSTSRERERHEPRRTRERKYKNIFHIIERGREGWGEMVDDLMVCVDRIIVASSCFEPVNNGERERNGSDVVGVEPTSKDGNVKDSVGSVKGNEEGSSCSLKKVEMVECRICQEEDEVLALEAPCSCNGTLKVITFLF
jgi:hypothetical protein